VDAKAKLLFPRACNLDNLRRACHHVARPPRTDVQDD
jgi:hypothetical protein